MTLDVVHNLGKKSNKEYTALVLNIGTRNVPVSFKIEDILRVTKLDLSVIDNMKVGEVIKIADVVKVK